MNILKYILIIILFSSAYASNAQYCHDFYKTDGCKLTSEGSFKPYGKSKSAMLEIKKVYEYKLVLYGEKDYKIAICTEYGFGPVHYVIKNARSQKVLYDNITDDYIESVGFTNEFTQSVIIELTILAEDVEIQDEYDNRACIGINIVWRKTPKLGF